MFEKINGKAIGRIVGFVLAAIGLLYVALAFADEWPQIVPALASGHAWLAVSAGTVLWAAAIAVLSLGWVEILARISATQATAPTATGNRRPLALAYCLSNISKYVPGNVMHFGARQLQAAALGHKHRHIASTSLLESAGLIAGAITVGGLVLLAMGDGGLFKKVSEIIDINTSLLAGIIALLAGLILLGAALGFRQHPIAQYGAISMLAACVAFGLILTMVWLVALSFGLAVKTAALVGALYVLAWVFGYLLPGAAAGIGVREAGLLWAGTTMFDTALLSADSLLLIALMARVANLAGDGLNFVVALVLSRKG